MSEINYQARLALRDFDQFGRERVAYTIPEVELTQAVLLCKVNSSNWAKKIDAIKLVRAETGWGLLESKMFVDEIWAIYDMLQEEQ